MRTRNIQRGTQNLASTCAVLLILASANVLLASQETSPTLRQDGESTTAPARTKDQSAAAGNSEEGATTGSTTREEEQSTRSMILNSDVKSSVSEETAWIAASGARWVWPEKVGDGPNQYVQMIHKLDLPEHTTGGIELAISADTNYAVWLNGDLAGFGQWSDYPDDKTYDLLDLKPYARPGANRLCILVYYQGVSTSQYRKGDPGLLYAVRAGGNIAAVSGPATAMRPAPDYVSGTLPRVSPQLSFTFEYHREKSDGWLNPDYLVGGTWHYPEVDEQKALDTRPVRPRPVPKLTLGARIPMRVVTQGSFQRAGTFSTPAVAMQTDSLSHRPAVEIFKRPRSVLSAAQNVGLQLNPDAFRNQSGAYVIFDAGREEAGILDLELEAPEGTVLDIAYGEHLGDLRVRASVGGRSFASRYVCGAGRNRFLHPFLRLAGRYIQIHVMPPAIPGTQPVTLFYVGLRPTDYPVKQTGEFRSPDSLHNKIWEVSARTLYLCMHEHYEDCPWREQALYAMDARNQILSGFYTFGNYDFVKASLQLLGQGMNEKDGFLELCAPANVHVTIPSFSLAWILSLDDYLLFSGDREFVRSQLPVARQVLETCCRETSTALMPTPRGERIWNFYEWAPGLDGMEKIRITVLEDEHYDAPLNLFYLLALDAAARVAKECGEEDDELTSRAAALRREFAGKFWDEKEKAFRTRVGDGGDPHFAELTQALAILAGVVPPDQLDALRERLSKDENGFVPTTLSHCIYKFEALMTDKRRYAPRVFELILRDWGYMLSQGATSFWETIEGAAAFGEAGSLCHGWSGIPAWFYGAYILGVKPTAPGFEKYEFEPVVNVLPSASGIVPTPTGALKVSWRLENGSPVKELVPVPAEEAKP